MHWPDSARSFALSISRHSVWNGPWLSFPRFLQKAFFNKNPCDLTSWNSNMVCYPFNRLTTVGEQITNGECFLDPRVKFVEGLRYFKQLPCWLDWILDVKCNFHFCPILFNETQHDFSLSNLFCDPFGLIYSITAELPS